MVDDGEAEDEARDWAAWAHATRKLGYAVTTDMRASFTAEEIGAWEAAIDEGAALFDAEGEEGTA
jgi:hypothetical protein